MRSSKIEVVDFKSKADKYLHEVVERKMPSDIMVTLLAQEFGISRDWVGKRFRTYYGMSISEKVTELTMPSREELVTEILRSETVDELWKRLNLVYSFRKGLFDKHFGVSNFARAKALCMMETIQVKYQPTIQDNLSLVCSQILGDGSYDKVRGSIRISHGEKQFEYALFKAGLFNKAFPTTKPAGNTSFLTHPQGHKCSSWYSGRLPSKITTFVEASKKSDLVKELTPLGVLLLCLDDAHIDLDTTKRTNSYISLFMLDTEAASEMVALFKSYGISCTVSARTEGKGGLILKIGTVTDAVMFYKCFIEPFLDMIPECMRYKTTLKI